MPRIGRIDVPDSLWAAMVEQSAKVIINNDLDVAGDKAGIPFDELDKIQAQLELQEYYPFIDNCHKCVIALIRMHTGDFLSDDKAIMHGEDFNSICEYATQQAMQINQNILSSDKQLKALRSLLSQPYTTMSRNLSSPS